MLKEMLKDIKEMWTHLSLSYQILYTWLFGISIFFILNIDVIFGIIMMLYLFMLLVLEIRLRLKDRIIEIDDRIISRFKEYCKDRKQVIANIAENKNGEDV